jgi:hypothetical protein
MNTKFIPKNIISTLAISKRTFFLLKATPKAPIQNINPENIKKIPKLSATPVVVITQKLPKTFRICSKNQK